MDNDKFNDDTNRESMPIDHEAKETKGANQAHESNEVHDQPEQSIIDVSYDDVTPAPMANNAYYHETIKESEQKAKKEKKKKGGMMKFLAGVVVASMVGGSFAGAGFALALPYANELYEKNTGKSLASEETAKTAEAPVSQADFAQQTNYQAQNTGFYNPVPVIAENVGPSVVSIINTKIINTWGGEYSESGLGSGVIFQVDDEKVYIVSNAHVVEGASTLVVNFLGNYKVPAQIVGYDTQTDIAVVSVLQSDIPEEIRGQIKPAPIGNSDDLHVGDMAVAIGTPIDEAYNNTVTVGYISALDREISLTDQTFNLIQTDAAINPGNSGGALVGPTGEVVGINTIKLVDSQIEGMGFAIPINDVKPIIEELMTHGRIIRPSLGIMGTNLQESLGTFWEVPVGIGVIEVVPGSSADIAGIQPGDIIIEFDGKRISTVEELQALLKEKQVGDSIKVRVVRGSDKHQVEVKLQELPQN